MSIHILYLLYSHKNIIMHKKPIIKCIFELTNYLIYWFTDSYIRFIEVHNYF